MAASLLNQIQDGIWLYQCNHFHDENLGDITSIHSILQRDLDASKLTADDLQNKNLIVDFIPEGHQWFTVKLLCEQIQQILKPQKLLVIFGAEQDRIPDDFPPAMTLPSRIVRSLWHAPDAAQIFPQFNHSRCLDYKFLSLNRRANFVRERLVAGLIKNIDPKFLMISLGSESEFYSGPKKYIDRGFWLDGKRDIRTNVSEDMLYCAFNIIAESSDQSQMFSHTSRFVTEKTYKAFAMCQIPMWMAVPGLVQVVRNYGFDVFDDILDQHRYDSIVNENTRCDAVVALATYMDRLYDLEQCQTLRKQLWPRLWANRLHVETMYQEAEQDLNRAIEKVFNDNRSNT